MWALRFSREELCKLTAAARQAGATKTGFLRWLVNTYYEENTLPELMAEAKQKGVTLRELLDEVYEKYRPNFAKEEEEDTEETVTPPANAKMVKPKKRGAKAGK